VEEAWEKLEASEAPRLDVDLEHSASRELGEVYGKGMG
jgi:hypothetical protein